VRLGVLAPCSGHEGASFAKPHFGQITRYLYFHVPEHLRHVLPLSCCVVVVRAFQQIALSMHSHMIAQSAWP